MNLWPFRRAEPQAAPADLVREAALTLSRHREVITRSAVMEKVDHIRAHVNATRPGVLGTKKKATL
ncbi:hypothetical protein [Sphingomonas montanisoli]|uniref:Uncharacterized protein n=1 Tax=Sphingomonas montanisoli TaxID=2606412 RepID=A0A5D9C6H1_9SPHN|nr:hypothetical protein [Sphingomonas montanisoli]TZG25601.1 hypothetical protein FYJ91_11285 [Sphingomonas montanisoli]